jgi:cytochrome c-type biogenesis protein CcmH/NrfG
LSLAREAVSIDPGSIAAQTALGHAAAASGQHDEASRAWQAAIENAKKLEPDAQQSYIPDLEAKLKKLPAGK